MPDINVYDSVTVQNYTDVSEFYAIDVNDSVSLGDWIDQFQRFADLVDKWLLPVREKLVFNTEILQSHNRTEQRISKRLSIPERHFTVRIILPTYAELSRFEALVHGRLRDSWAVPLWPLAETLTENISAGQTSINLDTRYAGFVGGGYVLVWQSKDLYDIAVITNFSDSTLNLKFSLINSYSGTTFVMPCRIGKCLSVSMLRRNYGVGIFEMNFRLQNVEDVIDYSGYTVYDNFIVLTVPAESFRKGFDYSYDPDIAVMDAGTGPFETVVNSDFNITVQPYGWICEDKATAWELRQFFHHINGMQMGFLVPTFLYDLELSRDVGSGDTDIYVINQGYANNMGINNMRTYVAFRPSGSLIVRKITSITQIDSSEEKITIDQSAGTSFSSGGYLCWVDLCRLASDEIIMNWYNRGRCKVEAKLLRVEDYNEPYYFIWGYEDLILAEENMMTQPRTIAINELIGIEDDATSSVS